MSNDIQAFPVGNPTDGGNYGMTLRDYFAGQALVGLLVLSPELCKKNNWDRISKEDMAENSYIYADAMLAERKLTR